MTTEENVPVANVEVLDPEAAAEKERKKLEKKAAKAAEKAAKEASKAARAAEMEAARKAKAEGAVLVVPDVDLSKYAEYEYGNLFIQSALKTDRQFVDIADFTPERAGQTLWFRARVHNVRKQGNKMCFLELRRKMASVQALAFGKEVAQFCSELGKESVVDVMGEVTCPPEPIKACTQSQVEIQIKKIFAVSRSEALPLQLDDCQRSQREYDEMMAKDPEAKPVLVGQDARLNNRIIELRTLTNQGIFRLNSGIMTLFRDYLLTNDFTEIKTPKMISAASEGGADVFKLDYFGGQAFLAQSPQLYKQMALMSDLERVFEITPVFRSEKSFTHRHLTEFTGLDMEMCFNEHYSEVLDMFDGMFNHIFTGLNEKYKNELEAVRAQFPFEDLRWSYPCLKLKWPDAMKLLREGGPAILEERIAAESCPETKKRMLAHIETVRVHGDTEDMSTEDEKLLGAVIARVHKQDFYIIDKFPVEVRPFYTMEDPEDPRWTNSYDIFLRGEEIMSGAQRIHDPAMLMAKANRLGVAVADIQSYIDAFKFGAYPHAGGGVGMERVSMLFLGLHNIRMTSMFPRDPKRLTP